LHLKFGKMIMDFTEPCSLIALPKELYKLKNLKKLILGGGFEGYSKVKLTDYSPIWKLENLEVLGLYNTKISNLEEIENLKKLKILILDFHKNLINIEKLTNLKNLETIQLDKTNLTSISFLRDLKKLQYISIGSNKLKTLSELNDHENILKICCCCNDINDKIFLPNSKKLKEVCFGNSELKDIISISHPNYIHQSLE